MLVRAASALACLLFLGLFAGCSHRSPKTCAPAGAALAVDVEHRELALCEDGIAASEEIARWVARARPAEIVIR